MTITKTLSALVDDTILELASPGEQGSIIVLGSDGLATTTDTELTLADSTAVQVSDVLEFGDELMLVTGKTSAAVPVLTVSRGYFMSTAAVHIAGDAGLINPAFPRSKISLAVRKSFPRLEALGVPLIKSVTLNRETDKAMLQLPADCREPLQVLYWGTDGRFWEFDGWQFFDNVPTAKVSTGKALNISRIVANADDLEVLYRAPYRWSDHPTPNMDSTIDIPEGAEDLPALYAASWALSSREISRMEIDRTEEWSRTAQIERGVTGSTLRAKWQEFYRALDEARRLNRVPQPIVYNRRQRL